MEQQCWSYLSVVERLKVNDIIFYMGVFEITWHEGLWACIYKRVSENGERKCKKNCVEREREMKKSWNIEPNKTNNSLETLSQRKQKVVIKHWTKGNKK